MASSRPLSHNPAAAHLVISTYILSQFVDVTLGSVAGVVVSVQKLAGVVVLSVGALLLPKLRWPRKVASFAVILVLSFLAAPILDGQNSASLPGDLFAVGLNFLAAMVVFSALCEVTGPMRVVGRVWLFAATATALTAIGQTVGWVPLVNVPEGLLAARVTETGLYRATGLKADPNFAAMTMVAGLAFTHIIQRRVWRVFVIVILFGGVFATFSRMGLFVALILLVVGQKRRATRAVDLRDVGLGVLSLAAVSAALMVGYYLLPPVVRDYVDLRVQDAASSVAYLVTGVDASAVDSSGSERAELARGTLQIIAEHPIVGVGPNNLQALLYDEIGVQNAAHNTYLELLAIGGLVGCAAIVFYLASVVSSLRKLREANLSSIDETRSLRMFCLAAALMALVLTVVYNSFLWIPLTLASAMQWASETSHNLEIQRRHSRQRDALGRMM